MAPLSPANGVPLTLPLTWSDRTQLAALRAGRQAPDSPSAHAARPVLLELLASVAGPPPKLPLAFWCRLSQVTARVIDARVARFGRLSSCRLSTASAVTSVSGALVVDRFPALQPCRAADRSAKLSRK